MTSLPKKSTISIVAAVLLLTRTTPVSVAYRIGDRVGLTFQARQSTRRRDFSSPQQKEVVVSTKTQPSLEPMQHQVPHFGLDAVNLTVPLRMLAAEMQQYNGAGGNRLQVDAVSMVVGDYFSLPWTDVMYSNPDEEVVQYNPQTQAMDSRPARYVLESLTVAIVYSRGDAFGTGSGGEIHSVFVHGKGPVYRKLTKEEEEDSTRQGHSALARVSFRLHYKWIEEPSVDQASAVGIAFFLCFLSTFLLFSLACRDVMVWTTTIDEEIDEYPAPPHRQPQRFVQEPRLQPQGFHPYQQHGNPLGHPPYAQHSSTNPRPPTTMPMSRTSHRKDKV